LFCYEAAPSLEAGAAGTMGELERHVVVV
jgi:hypothetical protein